MSKVKSALKALGMTKWFVVTSWGYIVTKRFSSKVEFTKGLLPAWYGFTLMTCKDCRKAS